MLTQIAPQKPTPQAGQRKKRIASHLVKVLILVFLALGAKKYAAQRSEDAFLTDLAQRITAHANARSKREKTIALRDYIRRSVRFQEAPYNNRPFLRATAQETITSKLGYCGEVSRLFICLAEKVGVPAQRVELHGKMLHVVAEAHLGPHEIYIVDSQQPPTVRDLTPLDEVMAGPLFDHFYSINIYRFKLNGLISRLTLQPSALTYWLEKPHLIEATCWWFLAALLLLAQAVAALWRRYLQHLRASWLAAQS